MDGGWRTDPRIPFVIAAILGMIAGVAAKQSVSITSGVYPRPISVLADFLVLGMIFLIVMYVHSIYPRIPVEGISLLSAALAMWGPRGIAVLLQRFKQGASAAALQAAKQLIISVEPVQPPTVASEEAKMEASDDENTYAKKAPARRLRDVIPLQDKTPADMVGKLAEADRVDPDYHGPQPEKGK